MRVPLATWPALCLLAPQPSRCAEPVAAEPSAKPYFASDQYLEEYGTLYDHLGMLSDHERMRAYHDAIRLNPSHFKDKVVLDVGTGTGVLAIWAAQAGARRVFAVEGTSVALHAETMAKAHGFGGVIEVLRGRMEDVQLPEPVDVIVSEWMGYFLLRESMIQASRARALALALAPAVARARALTSRSSSRATAGSSPAASCTPPPRGCCSPACRTSP